MADGGAPMGPEGAGAVLRELARPGRRLFWCSAVRAGHLMRPGRGGPEPVATVTEDVFVYLWRVGALVRAPGGRRFSRWTLSRRGAVLAGGGS